MNNIEHNFWLKIKKIREHHIILDNIKEKNKKTEESNKKIILCSQKCLNDKDILKGTCELYKKYKIIRIGTDFVLKYYMSLFKKYMENDN